MTAQRETVVLVHGLYVHGLWMRLLEYWLEQSGYHTVNFSYPSMTRSPAENAEDLHRQLERVEASTVHFLAHSMGGLVVRHLFHHYPQQRPGRIVTLGTPIRAVTPPRSCITADWVSSWARAWKPDCSSSPSLDCAEPARLHCRYAKHRCRSPVSRHAGPSGWHDCGGRNAVSRDDRPYLPARVTHANAGRPLHDHPGLCVFRHWPVPSSAASSPVGL